MSTVPTGFTIGETLLLLMASTAAQASGPVFTTLHSFAGRTDGANPSGALTVGSGGVLFGATAAGGATGAHGTVFSLTPPISSGGSWTESPSSFPGSPGGSDPNGALVIGPSGALYGTTVSGGTGHNGLVFVLIPPASPGGSPTERPIYKFKGGSDGSRPAAGLVVGSGGVLYGTTQYGGASNNGTVFSLTPPAGAPTGPGGAWTETVLYTFTRGADGGLPQGSLVIGKGGVLYGATTVGGTSDWGVVFSLTPPAGAPSGPGGSWTQTTLHSFTGQSDGGIPRGRLLIGSGGVLYGTTEYEGPTGNGVVFALTPPASPGGSWTEAVLYGFGAPGDGYSPDGIVFGSGGVIYGSTPSGGANLYGTVFSLTPPAGVPSGPGGPWTETLLHAFSLASDGGNPVGGVVIGSGGVLYGATTIGGSRNKGTAYSLVP